VPGDDHVRVGQPTVQVECLGRRMAVPHGDKIALLQPPPLLKAWQDAVLTRMFYINAATEGALIAGRPLMVAATAGNQPADYAAAGANLLPLPDLLCPLYATAHRGGLDWREPFLLFNARAASDDDLRAAGGRTPRDCAGSARTCPDRIEPPSRRLATHDRFPGDGSPVDSGIPHGTLLIAWRWSL
jgi:Flavodoxin-like fold